MANARLASSTASDWNSTSLWVSGTLPTAGDNVYLEGVTTDIATAPSGTNDVLFASLNIDQSYTGDIGAESTPLGVIARDVKIGYYYGSGSPAGSGRVNLDLTGGTNYTSDGRIVVYDTASSPTDSNREPVRIISDSTHHSVEVRKGYVGLATNYAGESSTFTGVDVSFLDDVENDAEVLVGAGVLVTNYTQTGGKNVLRCGVPNINVHGGQLTIVDAATATTITVGQDGTAYLEASGTITTLNIAGNVDMTRSSKPRTVSNVNIYDGATFKADWQVVTFTNGIDLEQTSLPRVTLDIGRNFTIPDPTSV